LSDDWVRVIVAVDHKVREDGAVADCWVRGRLVAGFAVVHKDGAVADCWGLVAGFGRPRKG